MTEAGEWCCSAAEAPYLIVDLQVGCAHQELALCSIPVILNVHEDVLNGPGDDTPAGPTVSPLHCEGLAGACLAICNDGCIVALQAMRVTFACSHEECAPLSVLAYDAMQCNAICCTWMQCEAIMQCHAVWYNALQYDAMRCNAAEQLHGNAADIRLKDRVAMQICLKWPGKVHHALNHILDSCCPHAQFV